MTNDEIIKKLCNDFSLLSDDQQNYILGILQALVFANSSINKSESTVSETAKRKQKLLNNKNPA